ncbi:glycosyltransferase family 2 protein [Rufibacter aurantiacus]|uniref:glycosyltransferase family 2 protein n=1 Tax=Rufibacter aurantiacus TaxID=2817374 RepID=UPI001FF07878|nr:glycosyltransferase family 2 protein [Rufibacter aurantiacus]
MDVLEVSLWVAIAIVFYTYVGYGLVAWAWAKAIARKGKPTLLMGFEPEVTLVVPAYNEAFILEDKIENCLALSYPEDRLKIVFITDGSTDHTAEVLAAYPQIVHLHSPVRGGKAMAENRAMQYVDTPFVIFTDCNSFLNKEAVRELVKHYQNPEVGAVSGEKKVMALESAPGAGEGLYWKYESFLKRCDSDIYSLMGAAGELVSFRSSLFEPLEEDTILDDFVQSLRIVEKGFKVVYEPLAFASETPSTSIHEEMKRKVRICAGGWQSMFRLGGLLNPFHQPVVTFLYVSHRVLRWSLAPLMLAVLIPLSFALAWRGNGFGALLFGLQVLFYFMAWMGWQAESRGEKSKLLLLPLYFTIMNVAVFLGFFRFVRKSQPAAWEKASRAEAPAILVQQKDVSEVI